MKIQIFVGLFCVSLASFSSSIVPNAQAATGINPNVNFQGKLTNPNGTNIANGSYSFVFSLYSAASAGTAIWTEADSLTLTDGIFQVNLGATAAGANANFGNVDFNSDSLYLGIKVGADTEMTPRVRFTATPYAFNAGKLGGISAAGFAQLSPASAQTGSLNVTGSVQAATSIQAPLLDAATAGSLGIGMTTATSINVGAGTTVQTITIGNSTGATGVTVNAGTGGIILGAVTTLATLGTANTSSSLCRNSSNQISACASGAGAPFVQGGNSFAAAGDLGTNDNFSLNLRTNNTTKLTITAAGDVAFAQGASRTLNVASATTADAIGASLTIAAGAANGTTTGNTGGVLALVGGAAAGTGNNNGGNITIDGGALSGSGLKGNLVLQSSGGNVGIGNSSPGERLDVSGNFRLFDQRVGVGATSLLVRAGDTQSTTDLLQVRNNADSPLSGFNSTGKLFIISAAFRGTVQTSALSTNQTYSLPNSSGQFCLDSGNCNGAGASLQTSYNNSIGGTTPELKLDSGRAALDIQDADTTIASNLFNVRASNGSGLGNILLGVGNTGNFDLKNSAGSTLLSANASSLAVTINNTLQTAATTTVSTPSNNLTVISGNATGATSTSGDVRIDTGTATGVAGALKIGDTNASSIVIGRLGLGAVIPAASSLTLGTASTNTGGVLFRNSTNGNTLTLQSGATTAAVTLTLPITTGGSGDCLTSDGTGVLAFSSCTSGIGTLAANTALSNLSNVAINLSLLPGTAGAIDIGSTTKPFAELYVSGTSGTPGTNNFKVTGVATAFRTITIPDASGTVCLSTGNCSGSSATLQSDYTNSTGGTTPEIKLDSTRSAFDIQDANTSIGSTQSLLAVRGSNASGLGSSFFSVNASGQTGINLGASAASADLTFGENISTTRKINVATRSTNAVGTGLSILGGDAGSGASAVGGGSLTLQGGNAAGTSGTANGGNVSLYGGSQINSGTDGNVILAYNGTSLKGRVGIGTGSPAALLHVVGAAEVARFGGVGTTGNASQAYATFYDSNGTTSIGAIGDLSTADSDLYVQASTGKNLQLGAGGATLLKLNAGVSVVVGSSTTDTTQINLQLDSSSNYADTGTCSTTTNQGALYYNTAANSIRGCSDGSWVDVITENDLGLQLFGVVPDTGNQPGDLASLVTSGVSGPCRVSWASASTIAIEPCVAYSGGRRVKVAAATLTITTSTTNIWQHVCLTGTDNQPALSTSNASATANLPTFVRNAPVLCLADIRNGGTNATIGDLFDIRTFTTTQKEFATSSVAIPLGSLADSASGSTEVRLSTAGSKRLYGTIIATDGSTSTSTSNIIIATLGPVFLKGIGGTAGDFTKASATTGFADTIAAIPNNSFFYTGGTARSTFANTCTSAATCKSSIYVNFTVR